MPVNISGFSKSKPLGTDSVRVGDDLLRSDKSILQATLDSEHYFGPQDSASSASGGVHRLGSARVFAGARSLITTPASADSAGRLYYSTDLGSLHYFAASSHTTISHGARPLGLVVALNADVASSDSETQLAGWNSSSARYYGSGVTLTNNGSVFTIQEGGVGVYHIHGSVNFENTIVGTVAAILYRNGAQVASASCGSQPGSPSISRVANFVHVSDCTSGDTFGVHHISTSACTVDANGGLTYISFVRL